MAGKAAIRGMGCRLPNLAGGPVAGSGYGCRVKRWALGVAALLLLLALVGAGSSAVQWAKGFEALAASGRADAKAGLKSLGAGDGPAALASFEKAEQEFRAARDQLGPQWLRDTPWLGRQLAVADDLAAIGAAGARAGAHAARLLGVTGDVTGDDRLAQLLTLARPHLDGALSSLVEVADRAERLSPDGLAGPLAEAVVDVQQELEPLALVLSRSEALLELERYLFSGQHRFLVLAQNSAQLRATGGFPGTYGLVGIGPDGFTLEHFADIYSLPDTTAKLPLPDGWRMSAARLTMRSANWWQDFPTSADTVLRIWRGLDPAQPAVDGVIAIDLPAIRDLLEVFGPIRVPESDVALTADNVVVQLGYIVEVEHSGQTSDQRKDAVVSLAKAVMKRLTRLSDDEFLPTMKALAASANGRHVQGFLSDPAAQASLVAAGWSGAVDPPAGTTDLVAVNNTVIARPAKGNLGVDKTLGYSVRLAADGAAATTLRLGYSKDHANPLGWHQEAFPNQVRVHRAMGTTGSGKGFGEIDDLSGLPTFANAFTLPKGRSATVELAATVPDALRAGTAAALPGMPATAAPATGEPWHYRLLLVKQADLVDTAATVTVTAPDGWRIVTGTAWFRTGGGVVDTTLSEAEVKVQTPLEQDLLVDVLLVKA